MPPSIVYDGLRLFLGAFSHTPRGIDRVDLAYARFLFARWPNTCLGLLPTPWGMRLYEREQAMRLLDTVLSRWREDEAAAPEEAFRDIRQWLSGDASVRPVKSSGRQAAWLAQGEQFLRENGIHWGQSAVKRAPKGSIYLNIGQLGWASAATTHWLCHRRDLHAVFMVHDVIPLLYPELVSRKGRWSHDQMLRSVLKHADGLITTTAGASDAVLGTLQQRGMARVQQISIPLPVADVFLDKEPPDAALRRRPYFVICGAIEPRKNHHLLLRVWQRLVQRIGPDAPRLVVLGSPAHLGDQIVRQILGAQDLQDHVAIVSGIASPAVRTLMANATGVLMPSFAEGFGLPVIEALTVGTPVLASDLPAHREAGGELGIYLDPSNEVAWFDAIIDVMDNTSLRDRIAGYQPMTSARYFETITGFLAGFA